MRRYVAVVIIGVLIVLLALLIIPTGGTETAPSEPSETEPEIIIEERNGLRIKGVFKGEKTEAHNQLRGERYLIEGMPCEVNEQETSEEGKVLPVLQGIEETEQAFTQCVAETYATVCETEPQASEHVEPVPVQAPESVESVPSETEPANDGLLLPDYLRSLLESYGIGWWYPYAYAQVMQESHWNPTAVNPNGKDFGLLQYRAQFWTGPGDIMDPYAQIQKYVGQVKARIDAGLSVEEIISRHMTSDYCPDINWQYVQDVLRWMQ